MKKIRKLYYLAFGVTAILACTLLLNRNKNMNEIKFRLSENIVETARNSGVPAYSARNVDGLVRYAINDIPPEISARYDVPGYEISFGPLFAFTMYADESNNNNLGVENVALQFSSKPFKTHEDGKKFAEKIIAEMNGGKWRRHIPELCPAVTGQSAFLNAEGQITKISSCPLDPHYTLTREEWLKIMRDTARYEWIGDNVLASFEISYSEDSQGITYNFLMELDDFSIRPRKGEQQNKLRLQEGDEKG